MDVSVIIVNWNTCELLRNCLTSIDEKAGDVNCEVIVVDNASSDGSVEMVENEFQHVILVKNQTNRGFASANNQGIAIAKGRYVLLLNSDTIILDEAIAKTVRFADAHPRAGVTGCRVLNSDRTLQLTCFMYPSILNMLISYTYLNKLFSKSRFFGREQMRWWNRDDTREVDVVTGCYMLARREAIEQVGGMDEQFFMYSEETDWCYRFKEAGWQIMFTPDAKIIHLGGSSTEKVRAKMILQWRKSMLLFFQKYKNPAAYGIAWILTGLFLLTRVPYWVAKHLFFSKVVKLFV